MRRVVRNHGERLRLMIQEAEDLIAASDAPQIVFAFQCRRGRHRSVACAALANAAFKMRGYDSCVQHVDLRTDPSKLCQVSTCTECRAELEVDRRLVACLLS